MKDVLPQIDRWRAKGEQVALATVIQTAGSTPRSVGAAMAITRSGQVAGSVSGGCLEGAVFEEAMQVLTDGQPILKHYGISDEMAFEVGLSCGGQVDIFIEPIDW
jgi:xanthine/CO dehydrogenase XdhC/CoxF family maturation factor